MDIAAILNNIIPTLTTIVAIGWSIEKILRLLDTILPKSVTLDNDIGEWLGKVLTMVGNLLKKKE